MSDHLTVYRSTHPDVLTAWNAAEHRADEIQTQRKTFLTEHGFEGRNIAVEGRWMIGVSHPDDQPIPAGWRRDRDLAEAIVPDRRTTVGKKLGAIIDELTMPSARKNLPGGMPEMAWGDHRMFRPGIALIGDALYMKWGCDPEVVEPATKIDPSMWERVKPSAYHLAIEAAADAKANQILDDVFTEAAAP